MKVLVVGGAGYIGSHCVKQLLRAGDEPIVLDNLVYGHRRAVPPRVPLLEGSLGDQELVSRLLREYRPDAVMHFAAYAFVGESISAPMKYYRNNVVNTLLLLESMLAAGVHRFVFSSTCATFGIPEQVPIPDGAPQRPINPYGQTKLDIENALRALAAATPLRFAALRYFNAAGADPDGEIGEDHDPETHLIPLVLKVALGQRPAVRVFGTDYPTGDGTAVRDFVHVMDLADAHLSAMRQLDRDAQLFYNLGTGRGHSVREVIRTAREVTGREIPVEAAPRRAGDPPVLFADSRKIRDELGWAPRIPDLPRIVETAWRWHEANPQGYADPAGRGSGERE